MSNVTGMISREVANARTSVKPVYASKTDISPEACAALLSAGTNRQGATCARMTPQEILDELQGMGYLGKEWGLTRRGTIKRQLMVEDELDALFN
jgi:hypothetical protein